MATIKQLIDDAKQVIAETQQGGNTQSRIGNLYLGIIDFLSALDNRTTDGSLEYDDRAIKEAIALIDNAIAQLDQALQDALAIVNQERERLDTLINSIDGDIEDKVNQMFRDAAWLEEHAQNIREVVNEGEIYWQSGWDAKIEAYLQEVGVWARDGDVIKTQWTQIKQDVASIQSTVAEVQTDLEGRPTSTQWSQITQQVNSIESSVNALLRDGEVTEALLASIKQTIDNGIAALDLESTYAKKSTEDAEKILEWMYAAFKNAASEEMSFAEMVAAGKSGLNEAVSDIKTYIEVVKNGEVLDYVAYSSIESKVNDAVTGLYNKASSEEASTTIFSQVKKDSENIATITTHATGDYSSASIESKFDNFRAGLITTANIDKAVAALLVDLKDEVNEIKSGYTTLVDAEKAFGSMLSKYNGYISGVITQATSEEALAQLFAQSETNGALAQIFVRANAAGSEITLNADHITMSDTFITKLTTDMAFINFLKGGTAEFSGKITAALGHIGGWEITEDTLRSDNRLTGLYSGEVDKSSEDNSPIRFWAGNVYKDNAPFYVTQNGFMKAARGTIGGFTIGNNYIGSEENGENLHISPSYMMVGNNIASVLLGADVAPGTAGGAFTMSMRIYNTKPAATYGSFTYDTANYGLYVDVKNGTKNYGVFSTATIRASAVYGDKVKTLDFSGSGSTYTIDLSQYNIYMMIPNSSNIGVNLPNLQSIQNQFSYSSLPADASKGLYFGVRFTLIYPKGASGGAIIINNVYNQDGNLTNWEMTSGDTLDLLVTNYNGFHYQVINANQ